MKKVRKIKDESCLINKAILDDLLEECREREKVIEQRKNYWLDRIKEADSSWKAADYWDKMKTVNNDFKKERKSAKAEALKPLTEAYEMWTEQREKWVVAQVAEVQQQLSDVLLQISKLEMAAGFIRASIKNSKAEARKQYAKQNPFPAQREMRRLRAML